MDMHHTLDSIISLLLRSGTHVSDEQGVLLEQYVSLLLEWNSRINLISRKDVESIWVKHILHSLSPIPLGLLPGNGKFVDIGTGGGLPGVPLAILLPKCDMLLVDSITKKIRVVEEIVHCLGLNNVSCRTMRVEAFAGSTDHAARNDVVFARGVTALPTLAKWSLPILKAGGRLLAWKGGMLDREIAETRRQEGVRRVRVIPIVLAGDEYFQKEDKKIIEVEFS